MKRESPDDFQSGGVLANRNLKILIADDNLTDRMILQTLVKKQGHQVVTAVDGQEAVELFEVESPDIVLLDALMPRKDGFEAARLIKDAAGEQLIPIIFLTSLSDAESLAKCLEAGGDDFLSKPYNPVILRAKINAFNRMRQMHMTLQQQRDQIADHNRHMLHEQQVAKSVFDNVAHNGSLSAPNIKYLLSPLSVFNGDVLLACMKPSGGMHVLLGDFTGHGLPAAIGAMPMAEIFYGMTRKGFALTDIIREINRKLKVILPVGFFCCACMVDLCLDQEEVEIWIGGLPEFVLRRGSDVQMIKSNHLPLGILSSEGFRTNTYRMEMKYGDRLYMWSDGIIEAANAHGDMFGDARLMQIFKSAPEGASVYEKIREDVLSFIGDQQASDDLTLIELTMMPSEDVIEEGKDNVRASSIGPRDWKFSYELRGESLRDFDPVPVALNLVMEVPELRSRSGEIYTIIIELYSNALEHGLLGMDSAMKSTSDGFMAYYKLREERLNHLEGQFVRIQADHQPHAGGGVLRIQVEDSGPGFDYGKTDAKGNLEDFSKFSGRGIPLLRKLCRSVQYFGSGNCVHVEFEWLKEAAGS